MSINVNAASGTSASAGKEQPLLTQGSKQITPEILSAPAVQSYADDVEGWKTSIRWAA